MAHRPDCSLKIWALGELHMDGRILRTPGASHLIQMAQAAHADWIVLPKCNAGDQAAFGRICYVDHLEDALRWVDALTPTVPPGFQRETTKDEPAPAHFTAFQALSSVPKMQWLSLLAAHGKHHALLCANPETDWSLFPTAVHELSMALLEPPLPAEVPLRLVQGLWSLSAGLGTGSDAFLQEISRAHGGLLAIGRWHDQDPRLDDLLNGPLEKESICVGRGMESWWVPARFQLVLATSTCPCGPMGTCICRSHQIQSRKIRFRKAFVDRLDAVSFWSLDQSYSALSTEEALERLKTASKLNRLRNGENAKKGLYNKDILLHRMLEESHVNKSVVEWLETEEAKRKVPRSRVAHLLRMARSLADLNGCQIVDLEHVKQCLPWNDAFG
jgi:magnesium chelatase family protein